MQAVSVHRVMTLIHVIRHWGKYVLMDFVIVHQQLQI